MEKIRRKIGYVNGIDVPSNGTRGDLSLGWQNGMDVVLRNYNSYHIDVLVIDIDIALK